jgi:hypothetical protein
MLAKSKLLFPSALVTKARHNHQLQEQHHVGDAQTRYREVARRCPGCSTGPGHLTWIYYRSEAWTWHSGCGTGGWLTLCDACHTQVDYFLEEISEHGRPEPIRVHAVRPPSVSA